MIAWLYQSKDSDGNSVYKVTFRDYDSGLSYVRTKDKSAQPGGDKSYTLYIKAAPGTWVYVRAVDVAGNVNEYKFYNPDPEFIQPSEHLNINPVEKLIDGEALLPQASPGIKDTADIPFELGDEETGLVSPIY